MAVIVPKSIVIKSLNTKQYLCYVEKPAGSLGFVSTQEQHVFNPLAKISVEQAKINSKYVHLRFTHTNKYWARRGPGANDHWIVASSDQPEEDRSKNSCTLFEPILESTGYYTLRHVQSGLRVHAELGTPHVFVDLVSTGGNKMIFEFVDWDTLVILPKHVAFRVPGDKGKFLKAKYNDGYCPYLEFSSEDGNEKASAYEITMSPDGHIRIWSSYFRKFWRRSPNWIWADSTDEIGNDIDTLFWPVKISNDTIALRNAGNGKYCKPLTTEGKTNCLDAADETISSDSHLKVEELVLDRTIYNLRYRLENARIYDETPKVVGFGSAVNDSGEEAKLTINVAFEDSHSFTFSNSVSLKHGLKIEGKTGIPLLVEGKIELSVELTNTLEWNRTDTNTTTTQAVYEVVVPAWSSANVSVVANRGTCDIPFSYTQRDKLSRDGSFVAAEHIDGIYTGVNYYSFRFEKHVMKSHDTAADQPKIFPLSHNIPRLMIKEAKRSRKIDER